MQSGHGKTSGWVLEYESQADRRPEPLMGWTAAGDTLGQVQLRFGTLAEAQAYARKKGLNATVLPAHTRRIKPRNYADNFRYHPPEGGA